MLDDRPLGDLEAHGARRDEFYVRMRGPLGCRMPLHCANYSRLNLSKK